MNFSAIRTAPVTFGTKFTSKAKNRLDKLSNPGDKATYEALKNDGCNDIYVDLSPGKLGKPKFRLIDPTKPLRSPTRYGPILCHGSTVPHAPDIYTKAEKFYGKKFTPMKNTISPNNAIAYFINNKTPFTTTF